jgi:hypothetical protein
VGSATGAVGGWLLSEASGWARLGWQAKPQGRAALLDLGAQCVLRESFEGYRVALAVEDPCPPELVSGSRPLGSTVIVPGAGVIDRGTSSALLDLLAAGSQVVFESGGGFLRREEFAAHRKMLADVFGLMVDSPVDLWSREEAVPYVTYRWPRTTMVRDFSRVVPVVAPGSEIIGRVGALPVASRKRVGRGLLLFVGSPLGPALGARDPESREWLELLLSASPRVLRDSYERA